MQLTPRGLLLTSGAMLAGGLALGIITTLAPAPALTSDSPAPLPSTSTSWSDADLGDQAISYPTSPVPTGTTAMATATPAPSTPAPFPTQAATTATPRSSNGATPGATPSPVARPDSRPTSPATSAPAPALATDRPSVRPSPRPSPRPSSRPARNSASPAVVRGGWAAPVLRVGLNDLAVPVLSSGAQVQVTVACSPSRACVVSGSDLLVDPAVASVTVTWSAPARAGYRAWRVSRAM